MTPRERAEAAAQQFPERLKAARKHAGLTQDQVVTAAEFAPATLSKIETGTNLPTFEILMRLAYTLELSPNDLTGWDSPPPAGVDAERRALLNELIIAAGRLDPEWLRELIRVAALADR